MTVLFHRHFDVWASTMPSTLRCDLLSQPHMTKSWHGNLFCITGLLQWYRINNFKRVMLPLPIGYSVPLKSFNLFLLFDMYINVVAVSGRVFVRWYDRCRGGGKGGVLPGQHMQIIILHVMVLVRWSIRWNTHYCYSTCILINLPQDKMVVIL